MFDVSLTYHMEPRIHTRVRVRHAHVLLKTHGHGRNRCGESSFTRLLRPVPNVTFASKRRPTRNDHCTCLSLPVSSFVRRASQARAERGLSKMVERVSITWDTRSGA